MTFKKAREEKKIHFHGILCRPKPGPLSYTDKEGEKTEAKEYLNP